MDRDERLAHIYARGSRLRRRWIAVAGGGTAAAALVVAALAVGGGPSPEEDLTAGPGGSSTTTTATTASSTTAPDPTTSTTSTTTSTHSSIGPIPPRLDTTTTTIYCRNSTNPQCGPMYYDPPAPPNTPTIVTFTLSDPTPEVGQKISILVAMRDPDDATVVGNCIRLDPDIGNVEPEGSEASYVMRGWCGDNAVERERYGPWDPPTPESLGYSEQTFEVTYLTAGEHTIRYSGRDPGRCEGVRTCPDRQVDHSFTVVP